MGTRGKKQSFKEFEKKISGIKLDAFGILPLMTFCSKVKLGELEAESRTIF